MVNKKILADTSILIDLQRGIEDTVDIFAKTYKFVSISRITASELLYGSRNKIELKKNQDFIDKLDVIEIDPEISYLSYKLISKYCLKTKIGVADSLIAATTIANNCKLWTNDKKHFGKIKEVRQFSD
jgi:predicted nucleic acid-binding protein